MAPLSQDSSSDLENGNIEKQLHQDGEKQKPITPTKLSHWRTLLVQGITTPEVEAWDYEGSGTEDDPYQVTWIDNDPRNPMEFSAPYKWMIVMSMALAVLGVSLVSSMYSGGLKPLLAQYDVSNEVGILGLSLFVLGFAIGPLFWAPFSEMFGRQKIFFLTYGAFVAFNGGVTASQNIQSIVVLRLLAGSCGSAPITNAGGVIADCFPARKRGLAMSIFAAAPFLGPALGPVIGGFLGESAGWRWVMGFMAIFSAVAWAVGASLVPETYAPVLLRRRAERLSKITGKVYRSRVDVDRGKQTLGQSFKIALTRPWILLFREPIVQLLSLYMAIVYGTLYLLFAAYPIVYQQGRGWSTGIGGLAFIGVLIGFLCAVAFSIFVVNPWYEKVVDREGGVAPPEARLPSAMLGGIMLPIGLFWFAWTNGPNIHWAVSIAAGIPFGAAMVLVFLSIMNYLVDSYTIFAASVMAGNAVLRSTFGAVFPLFTTYMYQNLGIHWASSIPAFLALACVPFPFLFYKFGPKIRAKCKYAAEADAFMKRLRTRQQEEADEQDPTRPTKTRSKLAAYEGEESEPEELEYEKEKEAQLVGHDAAHNQKYHGPRYEGIKSGASSSRNKLGGSSPLRSTTSRGSGRAASAGGGRSGMASPLDEWDDNPYTVDRVDTRDSFRSAGKDRSESRDRSRR